MKTRIRYGYSGHTNNKLLNAAVRVHEKMRIEPATSTYPTIQSELMLLGAAIDEFTNSIALENTQLNKAIRAADRNNIIDLLEDIGMKVSTISKGDQYKLACTGYEFVKTPTSHKTTPMGIPQNVRAYTTGTSGQALVKCDRVPYAANYEAECCLDLNINHWVRINVSPSSCKMLFTGLERGKDHFFRVRANGSSGASGWSDVYILMVI